MAILEIIKDSNQLIREKSLPIKQIDSAIKDLMNSMLETMYHEEGIGIAAIQVGYPVRALIVDIPKEEIDENGVVILKKNPFFIINPEIKELSQEQIVLPEGCLSVRQEDGVSFIRGDVQRPISITIDYLNLDGVMQELAVNGTKSEYDLWFARCLQHEIDHLDGILFTDKLFQPIQVDKSSIEVTGKLRSAADHQEL